MAHILVIGGTGMLAGTCLALCSMGYTVSAVGRRAARHSALMRLLGERKHLFNPVSADYTDQEQLSRGIWSAIALHGPPAIIISWIHSHAQCAHAEIAALAGNAAIDYFHVRGSTDPRALGDKSPVQQQFEAFNNVRYHQVVLGFVAGSSGSRWLTDEEISQGVLEAVRHKKPVFIVGTLEPFSARPGG